MNCTNCGKEIPEGESKLCEECQSKLLEELSKEEKTTEVDSTKEEKKEKKSKKEKKNKKEEVEKEAENKEKSSSKYKISNDNIADKKNIVIAIAIIIILVAVGLLLVLKVLGVLPLNNIGNSIGNIRNYGYATTDGRWIYYLSPSEDTQKVGICKVKRNGEDKAELLMDDFDILSMNVYKKYIYFIGIGTEEYSFDDDVDNKIYRMKTDGSDLEVINDNEFNNECYEIYVLNNSIYYIGTDENIYKMNLDGTNRQLVSDNGTGYLGITNKYIIYNVENEAGDNYVTYIMDLNGKNPRPILENKRLYSVDISGNYVYYTDTEKKIFRTKIDSGEEELVLDDTAYNLNLNGDNLYFLNYLDEENEDYTVALFRVKADGSETEAQNIKTLSSYSTFIDVVGDWVMYMDNDDTSGFINLVNKNGTGEEKKVFVLDYATYYENIDNGETTEQDANAEKVPEDTTNTQVAPENTTNTQVAPENTTNTQVTAENTTNTQVVPESTTNTANVSEANIVGNETTNTAQ